jgi:hypothetical protein
VSRLAAVRRWWLKVGLPIALTLAGVAALDRAIGRREGGGPYRQEIQRPIEQVRRAPAARHIVVGCSTSNWFAKALRSAWKLGPRDVVDAHMSDCLQACTMAEARHLQALGRRFQTATFGVNSFEYCEAYRERRSMQEVELMPFEHSLDLARVYSHSDDPLRYVGGWLMNQASLVYGNTMWLQRHARKQWFGNESLDGRWFRREVPPKGPRKEAFSCDYAAADRDFGKAATRGALRALSALADRVQLVLLPDKQHSADSEEARRTRELFAFEQRELAADFERVELIDLLDPELTQQRLFRDGAHFNAKGVKLASAHLMRRVRRLPELARAGAANPARHAQAAGPPRAGTQTTAAAMAPQPGAPGAPPAAPLGAR